MKPAIDAERDEGDDVKEAEDTQNARHRQHEVDVADLKKRWTKIFKKCFITRGAGIKSGRGPKHPPTLDRYLVFNLSRCEGLNGGSNENKTKNNR